MALVDLRLPDGDGTALAPQLKALAPDGEVVLLTGFATLESAVAAVRAGACAYLVKPCATQELLVTVEQAMRQVRLHGEKRELARRAQMAEKLAAVGTMTAGLSHEIRNPLNAAALQLTVLERRIQQAAPARSRARCSSRCTWCATRSGGSTTSSRTSSSSPGRASSCPGRWTSAGGAAPGARPAGGRGRAARRSGWSASSAERRAAAWPATRSGCARCW